MKTSTLITVVITALTTTLLVGGGVYAYLNATDDDLRAQLEALQAQATPSAQLATTPASSPSPVVIPIGSPSVNTTSTTKTYTNAKYKLSFSYPKTWVLSEFTGGKAALAVTVSDVVPSSDIDRPHDFSLSVTEYVKPLEYPSFTPESLKAWLYDDKNLEYKNPKAVTTGGRDGFSAQQGENKVGGGLYYFIAQKDQSIVTLYDFRQDASTKAIIDSIQFAK